MIIIFDRLGSAGLKYNAPKCIIGLNNIPYLGYLIIWEGIRPDINKVQGIMVIGRPTTKTKPQALIGVVQYYMNMWTRRSHILDPLI